MTENTPTLILAPLQGFTDVTFRNAWARHFSGMDLAMAPFISTMGQQRLKPSRLADVDLERNRSLFVIPQILGNVAEDFIFLADRLYEMGHKQVNWNLGCPHSKIAKKRRGSGLLLYPEKIDAMLSKIIPGMKPSLSVKIRLGRRNKDEIDELLKVFHCHKIDEIILHPRTGEQMYTGDSDLDAFEKALSACSIPMVYNGDIVDLPSYNRVRARFPEVTRIMIGRGILSNPFLAEEIRGRATEGQAIRLARIKAFHDDLFAAYEQVFSGPGHLTGRMKGFWSYLGPSFQGYKKPLKKILKATTIQAYSDRVDDFFNLNLKFGPDRPM
ncbi:MAG: tRNA-dihydrouridine synthase family protein [Desulfobacter sp.]|nr:MAG: tRNA-dihydrouridine synthase family protein [Desulfobacter sp.]